MTTYRVLLLAAPTDKIHQSEFYSRKDELHTVKMAAEVAAALITSVLSSRCSNFRIEIVFSISPEKINYISWLLNIKTQN